MIGKESGETLPINRMDGINYAEQERSGGNDQEYMKGTRR